MSYYQDIQTQIVDLLSPDILSPPHSVRVIEWPGDLRTYGTHHQSNLLSVQLTSEGFAEPSNTWIRPSQPLSSVLNFTLAICFKQLRAKDLSSVYTTLEFIRDRIDGAQITPLGDGARYSEIFLGSISFNKDDSEDALLLYDVDLSLKRVIGRC